jgi:hypothetical protein
MSSCAITIPDFSLDYDPSIDDYCGPYHFGRHLGCIEISRQPASSGQYCFFGRIIHFHFVYKNKKYDYDYPLPNDFHQISLLRDGYFAEIADTFIFFTKTILFTFTYYL